MTGEGSEALERSEPRILHPDDVTDGLTDVFTNLLHLHGGDWTPFMEEVHVARMKAKRHYECEVGTNEAPIFEPRDGGTT